MHLSSDSFRESVVADIKKMKQEDNIETSALKVEYITLYQKHGYENLPPKYLGLKNLFINMSCTKENTDARRIMGIDILFDAAISTYGAWCEDYERRYGMGWLADRDSMTPAADVVFNNLVREFNIIARHNPEMDWTPKKTAEEILSFMMEYYTINWQNGSTIEEDMLDCMMYPADRIQ